METRNRAFQGLDLRVCLAIIVFSVSSPFIAPTGKNDIGVTFDGAGTTFTSRIFQWAAQMCNAPAWDSGVYFG